jgi:hypothetical protein
LNSVVASVKDSQATAGHQGAADQVEFSRSLTRTPDLPDQTAVFVENKNFVGLYITDVDAAVRIRRHILGLGKKNLLRFIILRGKKAQGSDGFTLRRDGDHLDLCDGHLLAEYGGRYGNPRYQVEDKNDCGQTDAIDKTILES